MSPEWASYFITERGKMSRGDSSRLTLDRSVIKLRDDGSMVGRFVLETGFDIDP